MIEKPWGQVFHRIDVGDVDRHLIALLDLELLQTERGRGRRHVDAHLVSIPNDLGSASRLIPSALACLTASANIGSARSQIEIGLILER